MKIFFNTQTFDSYLNKYRLPVTESPDEAIFLVLGAKKVNYAAFKKLKGVYRFGVGTDNIDFEYLKQHSVPIHFPGEETKHILFDASANFTVYGILSLLYKNAFGDVGSWKKTNRDYIGHKNLLVIGTGNVGRMVANKMGVFMGVKTFDVLTNKPEELKPLVLEADVITAHIPLNDGTRNFFNEEKLSWVKDSAIIINTARGALFDEDALYAKLKTSNCRAFFDVFWQEPYNGKLKDLGEGRFYMTPHTASNTKEFINAGFKDILRIWEGLTNE